MAPRGRARPATSGPREQSRASRIVSIAGGSVGARLLPSLRNGTAADRRDGKAIIPPSRCRMYGVELPLDGRAAWQ